MMQEPYPDQIDMMTEAMLRDECRKLVSENLRLTASLAAQPSVRAELRDARKEVEVLRGEAAKKDFLIGKLTEALKLNTDETGHHYGPCYREETFSPCPICEALALSRATPAYTPVLEAKEAVIGWARTWDEQLKKHDEEILKAEVERRSYTTSYIVGALKARERFWFALSKLDDLLGGGDGKDEAK